MWGLQTQVRKRGLVLQTHRRHNSLHGEELQRHMAQQGGRDTSGEGRQRPTPQLAWTMEQQVGIRQGGETAGGSGGSCSGNALAFSCPRPR